jgi:GDPmannose 4,6-dehydratase
LLLLKGYRVHGIIRTKKAIPGSSLDHLSHADRAGKSQLHLHAGDLRDGQWLASLLGQICPHEIYNFAAQSSVSHSFDNPGYTSEINEQAFAGLLSAIRDSGLETRVFQASSSEMFGATPPPHSEGGQLRPLSPYAVSKASSHVMTQNFRDELGMFAVSGISFNHDSPRRPDSFVARKISRGVASIISGESQSIVLGTVDAIRDWGYAPEYVEGMWRSLQVDAPQDYVFATGEGHSVRDYLQFSCEAVGLDWQDHIELDSQLLRPADVPATIGHPARALRDLGWQASIRAQELARIMVGAELSRDGGIISPLEVPQLDSWS